MKKKIKISLYTILSLLFVAGAGYWGYQIVKADIYGSSLVAWYTLDSNDISGTSVTDKSGNGNTGTTQNSPTAVPGKLGQALKFVTASNQYIDAGNNSSVQVTGNITLATWFNATAINFPYDGLIVKGYDGSHTGYQLDFQNDVSTGGVNALLCASYNGSSFGTYYAYGSNIVTGKWYHAVCTYDGTNWNLYLNGTLVAHTAGAQGAFSTSQNLIIGEANFGGASSAFSGSFDDVRVYNRALSAAEMAQLYEQGLGRFNSFNDF